MHELTLHDEKGEIQGTVQMSIVEDQPLPELGWGHIDGRWSPRDYYVDEGVAVERPSMNLVYSIDGSTLTMTSWPSGVKVQIDGVEVVTLTDQESWTWPGVGEYSVGVEMFPYKPKHFIVGA